MADNLKWKNLKDGLCPSCFGVLTQDSNFIKCTKCSFKITEKRLEYIIRFGFQPVENTVEQEERRLQEINNLQQNNFNPYQL